jgi:hypothetical protein
MSAREGEDVVLLGAPRTLSGRVARRVTKSEVVPVSVTIGRESTVYRATLRPAATGDSELRLRLPAGTPPGTYTGEATLDGKPQRVRLQVEPLLRLTVEPRQSHLSAQPGSEVEFICVVANDGNVPFDIPKADTFDLDDAVAQDRALGRTLRAKLPEGEHPMDHLFDVLRDAHGGEASIAIRAGAGPLVPGDSRDLTCVLRVPASAQAGRSYFGSWQLGNVAHMVVADIAASVRPAKSTIAS